MPPEMELQRVYAEPNLQKQLADLAEQQPEVCCRKAKGEASGVTYQVRNAAVLIEPALLS